MTTPAEDRAIDGFIAAFCARRGNTGMPPLSEILTRYMKNEGPEGRRRVIEASMKAAQIRIDFLRTKVTNHGREYRFTFEQSSFAEHECLLNAIPGNERTSPEFVHLAGIIAEARDLAHWDIGIDEHLDKVGAALDD